MTFLTSSVSSIWCVPSKHKTPLLQPIVSKKIRLWTISSFICNWLLCVVSLYIYHPSFLFWTNIMLCTWFQTQFWMSSDCVRHIIHNISFIPTNKLALHVFAVFSLVKLLIHFFDSQASDFPHYRLFAGSVATPIVQVVVFQVTTVPNVWQLICLDTALQSAINP